MGGLWQLVEQTQDIFPEVTGRGEAPSLRLPTPLSGHRGDCIGWFHTGPGIIPYDKSSDEILWARGGSPKTSEIVDLASVVSGRSHRTYSVAVTWEPLVTDTTCFASEAQSSSHLGVSNALDIVRAAQNAQAGQVVMMLGVGNGELALLLSKAWPSAVWYLIDPFISPNPVPHEPGEFTDDDYQEQYEDLRRRLRDEGNTLLLIRDFSFSVAKALIEESSVANSSMGERPALVFRDIQGSYEAITADLEAWWPLLQPSGFFAGTGFDSNPDTRRAVEDFAVRHSIPLAGGPPQLPSSSDEISCWFL